MYSLGLYLLAQVTAFVPFFPESVDQAFPNFFFQPTPLKNIKYMKYQIKNCQIWSHFKDFRQVIFEVKK